MILRILTGIAIAVAGYFMVIKTGGVMDFFGPIPSAEHYLGPGGTRLAYKLFGVGVCILGFLVMTNLFERVMESLVFSVFG
jgi:hypothetical protein